MVTRPISHSSNLTQTQVPLTHTPNATPHQPSNPSDIADTLSLVRGGALIIQFSASPPAFALWQAMHAVLHRSASRFASFLEPPVLSLTLQAELRMLKQLYSPELSYDRCNKSRNHPARCLEKKLVKNI